MLDVMLLSKCKWLCLKWIRKNKSFLRGCKLLTGLVLGIAVYRVNVCLLPFSNKSITVSSLSRLRSEYKIWHYICVNTDVWELRHNNLCICCTSSSKNDSIAYWLVNRGRQSHKHHFSKKREYSYVAWVKW